MVTTNKPVTQECLRCGYVEIGNSKFAVNWYACVNCGARLDEAAQEYTATIRHLLDEGFSYEYASEAAKHIVKESQ